MTWSIFHCQCGAIPPLAPFYVSALTYYRLAPFQLEPKAYIILGGLYILFQNVFSRAPTMLEVDFFYSLKLKGRSNSAFYCLKENRGFIVIEDLQLIAQRSKERVKKYTERFFFVRSDVSPYRDFQTPNNRTCPVSDSQLIEVMNGLKRTVILRSALSLITDESLKQRGLIRQNQSIGYDSPPASEKGPHRGSSSRSTSRKRPRHEEEYNDASRSGTQPLAQDAPTSDTSVLEGISSEVLIKAVMNRERVMSGKLNLALTQIEQHKATIKKQDEEIKKLSEELKTAKEEEYCSRG